MASDTHPPFPMTDPLLPSSTSSTDMHSSEWFSSSMQAPTSFAEYDYQPPYITPYTTSMASFSPIAEFHKFNEPQDVFPKENVYPSSKSGDQAFVFGFNPVDNTLPTRPRSSPSTFSPTSGHRLEDIAFTPNGLGITHSKTYEPPTVNSPYPALGARPTRLSEPRPSGPAISDIITPQPRRTYTPIAPNPNSNQRLAGQKHSRDDDESQEDSKRRKRSDSAAVSTDLTEEDKLLMKLKDEEALPWKDIAARFQSDLGKTYQIPALQMRLKRLRERLRVWNEPDVKALRLAHEYWIQSKFDIIASKMIEFGALERWSSRQCHRKWQEVDPGPTPYSTYDTPTPNYSQYTTSPIEGPQYVPYLHMA